jgi:hypothetical protein
MPVANGWWLDGNRRVLSDQPMRTEKQHEQKPGETLVENGEVTDDGGSGEGWLLELYSNQSFLLSHIVLLSRVDYHRLQDAFCRNQFSK